jgi:Rrf2 family nitric oxide-sensitive transcriptional repressor
MTQFSNFAVRVLMYAALNGGRPSSVPEIARAYGVSHNHLKKAAAELRRLGYVEGVRGRVGGLRLARPPEDINIGAVIRATEGDVTLVECFDGENNTCPLLPACELRRALHEALAAFFQVLDGYTLADLLAPGPRLASLLGMDAPACGADDGSRA